MRRLLSLVLTTGDRILELFCRFRTSQVLYIAHPWRCPGLVGAGPFGAVDRGPIELDPPQNQADNGFMILRGRVQDGVVVLEPGASLPEGTEVTVGVCAATNATGEKMSDNERRRILEFMDRIAALPNENPGDNFSGADHDQVLYRNP